VVSAIGSSCGQGFSPAIIGISGSGKLGRGLAIVGKDLAFISVDCRSGRLYGSHSRRGFWTVFLVLYFGIIWVILVELAKVRKIFEIFCGISDTISVVEASPLALILDFSAVFSEV